MSCVGAGLEMVMRVQSSRFHADVRSVSRDPLVVAAAAAFVFSALAIYELRNFPFPRDLDAAVSAIVRLLPVTGAAAVRVWAFWAWWAVLIAIVVHKLDPKIGRLDCGLIGAAGVWVLAYFLGTALGPIGLFRASLLWVLGLAGTIYLWRDRPGRVLDRPSFGLGLALIAIGLAAVSLIPLQLASPVAPYMDVLSWPASAQRVLTFGVYLPFDNDPYGIWGPNVQQPALELFYAFLGLGSFTRLAAVAESTLIFPIGALTILATYRLGVALFDDTAGGAAALLLFLTTIFRWAEGMRGTAVAFVLAALGLALFIDPRRNRILMASGALMLGAALPSHAIDGALALGVALVAAGSWLLARDVPRFKAGVLCLSGAVLFGAPEFFIASATVVPVPLLVLFEAVGAGLVIYGATRLIPCKGAAEPRGVNTCLRLLLLVETLAIGYDAITGSGSLFGEVPGNFPVLGMLAVAGLLALISIPPSVGGVSRICVIAAMLLPPFAIIRILTNVPLTSSPAMNFATFELTRKIADYWMPFVLVFPAARFIALLCELVPKAFLASVLLASLILAPPRKTGIDYYTHEHSIGENWMVDFSIVSNGYWTGTSDSRWTFDPVESRLNLLLLEEVRAGRITPSTHILHLVRNVSPSERWARFSVFTGIDDDPVVLQPPESEWPMFLVGSRARAVVHLDDELSKRPPYILEEIAPPGPLAFPPAGYERIFDSGGIQLYRRSDLLSLGNR